MTDETTLADRYGAGVEKAGVLPMPPLAFTMAERAMRMTYRHTDARGHVRGGMGDAAHLCDAIAHRIANTGRKSKRRDELAAVAKECGDAIWAMRELVRMDEAPLPTPGGSDE